jgi:nitroreductase
MEFTNVVRARRMVRRFADEEVPRDVISALVDLAVRAPSAGFTQGWQFVVLDTEASRSSFWTTTAPDGDPDAWLSGMMTAPVVIAVCADKGAYLDRYAEPDKGWVDRDESRWPIPFWETDAAMAAMILLLAATDQGLGACLFGIPTEHYAAVHSLLGITGLRRIVGMIALGYPEPRSGPVGTDRSRATVPHSKRPRRALSDVLTFQDDLA